MKKILITILIITTLIFAGCSQSETQTTPTDTTTNTQEQESETNTPTQDDSSIDNNTPTQDDSTVDNNTPTQEESDTSTSSQDDSSVNNEVQVKEFDIIARQWEFDPNPIEVNVGDRVILNIESVDVEHGISIPEFGINEDLPVNETITVEFVADQSGTFSYYCSVFCGSGHRDMTGEIIVN